jgi:hypothetical protein
MTRAATDARAVAGTLFRGRREIGPIGTAARTVGGLVAIALPIALGGLGWWEAGAAFVALPLLATAASAFITAAYARLAPEALARRHAICSGPACWLFGAMIGATGATDALTPVNGEIALWVWLGVSMLVAAGRGYGGCEAFALPNLITGRRDRIGCILYTPIDNAEARRRASQLGHAAPAR